jgi:hypothetical protein
MADPDGVLEGANLKLKKVRFLTFEPGARLETKALIALTREGAAVAQLSRADRLARSLEASDVLTNFHRG